MPLRAPQFLSSRGRAHRWLRPLERRRTLYGLQTRAKILAFNNLCGRLLMMVGIVCVRAAWNLLTTCFFNVLSQQIFGSFFSLFKQFGLVLLMPKSVYELLGCWHRSFYCHRAAKVCEPCLCHEESEIRKKKKWIFPTFIIKEHTLQSLCDWMHVLGSNPLMSFIDFFTLFPFDLYSLKRDHTSLCASPLILF